MVQLTFPPEKPELQLWHFRPPCGQEEVVRGRVCSPTSRAFGILKEHEAGTRTAELLRRHGIAR